MIARDIQYRIAKRFTGTESEGFVKKAFQESIANDFLHSPESDTEQHSAVVFIDVAGFSELVSGMNPRETRDVLDEFYFKAIPVIYKNNGLIDRIVGDGIVAVFSPFLSHALDNDSCEDSARSAAANIVLKIKHETKMQVKAAVYCDKVLYCKTGLCDIYEDYTIIGKAVTAVYRMEEVAESNQVLIPHRSRLGSIIDEEVKYFRRHKINNLVSGNPAPIPDYTMKVSEEDLKGIGLIDVVRCEYQH